MEEGTASPQQGGWEGCLDREGSQGKGAASTTATWEASLEESLKTQTVSSLDRWLQPSFQIILGFCLHQVTSLLSGGGGFGGGSSVNYGLPSTCPEGVRQRVLIYRPKVKRKMLNFEGEPKYCIAGNSSGHCSGCWSAVQSNHPAAGEEEEEEERRGRASGGRRGRHGDAGDQQVQQVEQGLGVLHAPTSCLNI